MLFYKMGYYSKIFKPKSSIQYEPQVSDRQELPAPTVKISEYILGGKVLETSSNELLIEVVRTFLGPSGTYTSTQEKTVNIASSTQVIIRKIGAGSVTKTIGKISDIKVGMNINFHSTEDIEKMDSFVPTVIEIIQKA